MPPDASAPLPSPALRVAQLVPRTGAEGPGLRFALWVQGCSLRCPGCCNPEMFAPGRGRETDVEALAARVLATPGLEGLSLLGGEPFEQAPAAAALAARVRAAGLSVMVFSGFTLEELRARPDAAALLAQTDLLVDGRYDRTQPESQRRWIGSRNQRLHFLTDRYRPDDPCFSAPNTAEVHRVDGEWLVNGWPALADRLRP
jgi:anaerobic ribonucleoside-triphosphate reductase activating protein